MAKKRGPIVLDIFGWLFNKRYKGILATNSGLKRWIRRRGDWDIREALAKIDGLMTQLESHTSYLRNFNRALLDIETGKFVGNAGAAKKIDYEKYKRGLVLASNVIARKLKELIELIHQTFLDLEVAEDSGHGLQYRNIQHLRDTSGKLRRLLLKIKRRKQKEIRKAVRRYSEDKNNADQIVKHEIEKLDADYRFMLQYVDEHLNAIAMKMLGLIRDEKKGSKRQATGSMEPLVAMTHIADDQLTRELKNFSKLAVQHMYEENKILDKILQSYNFDKFKQDFNELISLYGKTSVELHELIEWIKTLFYRIERRKRKLVELLFITQNNNFIDSHVAADIKESVEGLASEIKIVLNRIEKQHVYLQNEANKLLKAA